MNIKKICTLILALAMALALAACGDSSSTNSDTTSDDSNASDATYELSFSMHDGSATLKYQYTQEWCDALEEATGGALHITIYPGGALASQDTAVEAMETGACDIAMVYTASYDTIFSLTNGVTLPMLGISTAEEATQVLWDLYEQSAEMQAEYEDYVLIHLYSNGSNYALFKDTPVSTFEEFSGLKIRSAGGSITDFLTLCNAVPMTISTSELYESLEKGLIDGNVGSGSQVASWNLSEVDQYFMDMPISVGVWMTLMNKDTFESLPSDIQDALTASGGREGSLTLASYLQEENDTGFADAVADGCEWVSVSEEEQEKFYNAALTYHQSWIEEHSTGDFDAQAYYDLILSSVQNHVG
ncbi:MAG: TRAP transporter substrate-binding protein DctP [Oscillospiraceae bacterium]|nr:TRAP transporter substrate-binding protein DctP [Oscillospiraceae bacterium]